MRGKKRIPQTKQISLDAIVDDPDLSDLNRLIVTTKVRDFLIKDKLDEIKPILSPEEVKKLRLCKLLYCTDYKKEMFLHLGVILESRLNSIVDLYLERNWRTPSNFDATKIEQTFQDFKKKKTLNDKANLINNLNLFNNTDASDQVCHKLQAFRNLRNYGGHSKSVNEFLDSIIDSQPDCDNEINDVCNLIKQIEIAKNALMSNPPPIR